MKLKLLFVAVLLVTVNFTQAQVRRGSQASFNNNTEAKKEKPSSSSTHDFLGERKLEISGLYAYQFGGKFYTYVGNNLNSRYEEVKAQDSDSYGISLSIPTSKWNTRLELSFIDQATTVKTSLAEHDVNIRYYQIGGIKEIPKGNMIPYGLLTMGATQIATSNHSDVWAFSITLGGGLKYYFNKTIGLKLEGRMLAPINYGGIYLGTGGSGVSASSSTLQGFIGAGLVFNLVK